MQTDIRINTASGNQSFSREIHNWKVGQIIKAVVVTDTPAGSGGGSAVIKIGISQYAVRSQTPLKSGQVLTLEVKRIHPHPVLQRLANASQHPIDLERNIATLLSRQIRLTTGIQSLLAYRGKLDPATRQRLSNLITKLPTPATLSQPKGLRHALANSGNQLENNLQQKAPPTTSDIKSQIAHIISGLPSQKTHPLHQTMEGMIARISLNQLQSVQSASTQIQLACELPVQVNHDFHEVRIEIEADKHNHRENPNTSPNWSVRLCLTPPGLGLMEVHVTSIGSKISARFWAEQSKTVDRLEYAMTKLSTALQKHGLKPGILDAFHGRAPVNEAELPKDTSGLLDIQA